MLNSIFFYSTFLNFKFEIKSLKEGRIIAYVFKFFRAVENVDFKRNGAIRELKRSWKFLLGNIVAATQIGIIINLKFNFKNLLKIRDEEVSTHQNSRVGSFFKNIRTGKVLRIISK